jgi:ribokinase
LTARIAVIGSIHIDFYISLPKLPIPGETVIGYYFTMKPGGKGANQAVACSRLGAYTYMIGKIGNDLFRKPILENFTKSNVDTTYVFIDEKTHTGIAFILLDRNTGENMIAVAPGADYKMNKQDINNAITAIKNADIVLLQLEIPIETVIYAIEKAWRLGKKILLNPAPAMKIPDKILKYIYILTPNRIEAEVLTGIKIKNINDAIKAGKILLGKGVKVIVITLGNQGSLLITGTRVKHIPPYKVKPIDTTGAGDAFNGALAVFLAEGYELEEACKRANAAAAIQITKLGAQEGLPTREELEDFLQKYEASNK